MFDPKAPGNRGLPSPRPGYEQRKVLHKNYFDAASKGWSKRIDVPYTDIDFVLCERPIEGYVDSQSVKFPANITFENPVTTTAIGVVNDLTKINEIAMEEVLKVDENTNNKAKKKRVNKSTL